VKQIRQRRRITIMRDDHLGDLLGAIFLDVSAQNEDAIIARTDPDELQRIIDGAVSEVRADRSVKKKADKA
jgi:hypothetical protein